MEDLFMPNSVRTVSGQYVNLLDPDPETILIEDIAHSLSMQCRFGGNLPVFYSVVQHCVMCTGRVRKEHKLAALLHDASKAYLLDVPSPLKKLLPEYAAIEERMMAVIAKKIGFPYPLPLEIKDVDLWMLGYEWETVFLSNYMHDNSWTQPVAKLFFLDTYVEILQEL